MDEFHTKMTVFEEQVSLLTSILDRLPDAIVVSLRSGRIIYANNEAEMLTGYHREQLRTMVIGDLIPMPLRERHASYRSSYFENPKIRYMGSTVLSILDAQAQEVPVEIMLAPVITTQGMAAIAVLRRPRA